jgi:hypothetical protein
MLDWIVGFPDSVDTDEGITGSLRSHAATVTPLADDE